MHEQGVQERAEHTALGGTGVESVEVSATEQ